MRFLLLLLFPLLFSCAKSNYVTTDDLQKQLDAVSGNSNLQFEEEKLFLTMKWEVFPTEESLGSFIMKFHDRDNPDILISPLLTPAVILWMPSMGHGSSPVTIHLISEGTYRVSDVFFTMPGLWDIRFQLKNGSDIIEQQILQITF